MSSWKEVLPEKNHYVFLGEAGSGKSELAINLALHLARESRQEVHFFDLDMTKPLFRSRDLSQVLKENGVTVHFQEQFMDAPTMVGGIRTLWKKRDCAVILDVGGDQIGSRAVAGFEALLNQPDTQVYYVLNGARPWSGDMDHLDETFAKVIAAAGIDLGQVRLIDNTNLGVTTTPKEFLEGNRRIREMVTPFHEISFSCIQDALYQEVADGITGPLIPIRLYLTYEWVEAEQ